MMYGEVFDAGAVIRLLREYDDLHFGNPAFNRGEILGRGGKSAAYNHDGARIEFQIQHTPDGLKVGLAGFTWNDEPGAIFIDGKYEAVFGASNAGPHDPPLKKGDPAPDGSGLLYAGDEDGDFSGIFRKPIEVLRAEFVPGVDEDGDGLDDATGAALGVVRDPFSPTGWSLAVRKDGSLP